MSFLHLFDNDLLASTLRIATPVALAALGGLMCMRAGVFNIALEGCMLVGAFFAIAFTAWSGSTWIGILGGAVAGVAASLLLAVAVLGLRANEIVAGLALNLLAFGLTGFLLKTLFGGSGVLRPENFQPLPSVTIPGLDSVPVLGPMLSRQTPLVYVGLALVVITHVILYRTPIGLAVRSVGEHADAARTAGINPIRIKLGTILWSGFLCGLAGAHLSLGYASEFSERMTQGRGFTAFSAIVFGQLDPTMTFLASLLFGFADAFGLRLQLEGSGVPPSIVQMFPYGLAIVALTASTALLLRRHRRLAGLSLDS
jgi:general nucleoside transport system permease protein